jgi:hypothetical protein
MYKRRNQYLGLTLLELMLGLMLSLFILGALTAIYLATLKNHLALAALETIQENSNNATRIMRTAIQTAGYAGCFSLRNSALINHTSLQFTPINLYEGRGVKPGTSAITIHQASIKKALLMGVMKNKHELIVSGDLAVKAGDILLITNCKSAEMFSVLSVDKNKIVSRQSLRNLFQYYAEIHRVEADSYFVGLTKRRDEVGQPIYALYGKTQDGKMELVEGIDDMGVEFEYSNEGKVLGVAIKIVATSLNNFVIKKSQYTYAGLYEN